MIVYVPAASVVDVPQLVNGNGAVQSVETADVKVTVPVAPPGSPLSVRVALLPKETLAGVALAVNDVPAAVTVNDAWAVEPA